MVCIPSKREATGDLSTGLCTMNDTNVRWEACAMSANLAVVHVPMV